MSAGVSNSKGKEVTNQTSSGSRKGTSSTTGGSDVTFNNASTGFEQTQVPEYAQKLNKRILFERVGDESNARDFLSSLLSDPYSGGTSSNRYGDAINRLFDTQLARARTGDASSKGIAKQGFREAAALTGAQDAAIAQGTGAANSLLTNASPLANLDWARLMAPKATSSTAGGTANTLTNQLTKSNDITSGVQQGTTNSTGSNSGFGITLCCFIFLEAYSGKLPWFVRRCRDEFASGPRVAGYRCMAAKLVPLMRKSKLVLWLVKKLMTEPLTKWGGWLYIEPGYKLGFIYFPIVLFWFGLWAAIGRKLNTSYAIS